EVSPAEHRAVAALTRASARIGATPAQVALAWLLRQPGRIHPILGARNFAQIQENLAALDVDLPDDTLADLNDTTRPVLGFPHDFIAETSPWVFGHANQ